MKSAIINARIEPALKASAEKIFHSLGIKTTDAISMFLSHVVSHRGIPFEVRLPNKATRQAIKEVAAGKGKRYKTSQQMMDDLLK